MSAILRAENLTKRFGDVTALDGFSIEVGKNEIVGLLGVNGAGKTTAMNIFLGLTDPTSGTARIFDRDIAKNRVEILRRCNFASAYTDLPRNLFVWQNLVVFAKIYNVKNAKEKISELLELFEISHLYKRVTGFLSAGESTRLHLCKALINDPEMLMLDEPTASLDPDIADKVRRTLRKRQEEKGMAILYTSHNMRDVEQVCDRIVFLHDGKVVTEGTPAKVKEEFEKESLEDVFIQIARSEHLVG